MIIIQLKGGLGNQLFQYAAARALALQRQTTVSLDVSSYNADQLRVFDLLELNVEANVASEASIASLRKTTPTGRLWSRLLPYGQRTFYKEPFFHFDPNFFQLPSDVYLQGYFQSEKYFLGIEPVLRQELCLKKHVNPTVEARRLEIEKLESVSIHIRRGDYQNKVTQEVHGIVPMSYYEAAIKYVQEQIPATRFFIFSDDGEWVAKHLSIPKCEIVSGRITNTHFEDFYLMQHCKHNIIANSSFSWWCAWLNANPNKTVIAPKQWFANGPKDLQDLIPAGWLRL